MTTAGRARRAAAPLRGHKFGPKYEGHMRSSNHCCPERSSRIRLLEIIATIDLLPTIAKLAGQTIPQDRIIDGQDVSDILLGKRRPNLLTSISITKKMAYEKGTETRTLPVKADRFVELYDLEKDLGEQNDLSKQYPKKVKALTEALDAHAARIEHRSAPRVWWRRQNLCLPSPRAYPLWLNTEKNKTACIQ